VIKLELEKIIKKKEPLILACHNDGDGLYSADLFRKAFKVREVIIPKRFGDYSRSDVGLDLGVPLKDYFGIVIDHHPGHQENAKYTLIWEDIPTGLIIYKYFKHLIPKQHHWKVVGSLVGDGQPELIPNEIWECFGSMLLEKKARIYSSYGNPKTYTYVPVYKLLNSGIRSMSRMGLAKEALRIISYAKTPLDIIDNPMVRLEEENCRKEEERIWKEYGLSGVLSINNFVNVFVFESDTICVEE